MYFPSQQPWLLQEQQQPVDAAWGWRPHQQQQPHGCWPTATNQQQHGYSNSLAYHTQPVATAALPAACHAGAAMAAAAGPPPARLVPGGRSAYTAALINANLLTSPHRPIQGGQQNAAARTSTLDQQAVNRCRQLNNRLRQAGSVQEIFAAIADSWSSLDCINISAAFHRLGQLAEATPGGLPAFRKQLFAPSASNTWRWLLDNLADAAQAQEFGPQCISNTLAALVKLDALSPSLLNALHAPLVRALTASGSSGGNGSAGAASSLSCMGLSQVMWAFGKEDSLRPLLLALKAQLFRALWDAAPSLDAQGTATVWWSLGELSSRLSPQELNLAAEAPDLLPRLAAAARAAAGGMTFQALSQVLNACTKMRPQPFKDEALLHTVVTAASRRLATEQPTPQAIGIICHSFGRLGFLPRCHWNTDAGVYANLLDDLGAVLASSLHQAKPQEVCSFVQGLGLLDFCPRPAVLHALLAHLGQDTRQSGGAAVSGDASLTTAGSSESELSGLSDISGGSGPSGFRGMGAGSAAGRQLVLEAYSSQELADLVCCLRRILAASRQYPDTLLPPAVVSRFFDSLDTVLRVRLAMAAELGVHTSGMPDQLGLTGHHVGSICHALGRLAGTPGTTLTEETLVELERHVSQLSGTYTAASLANLLHFYASHELQMGQRAAQTVCERALVLLQAQNRQPTQLTVSLSTLGKLLWCLGALRFNHPRLLCALLPAVAASLAAQQQAAQQGAASSLSGGPRVFRDLITLAVAVGQLQAGGLLAPAGLASVEALLPLWRLIMDRVASAANSEKLPGSGATGPLQLQDARMLYEAAAELNAGLAGGRGVFCLPPVALQLIVQACNTSLGRPEGAC